MVKTRHSVDQKGGSSPDFLSLGSKSDIKATDIDENNDDDISDDSSGVIHFTSKGRSQSAKNENGLRYSCKGRIRRKVLINEEEVDDFEDAIMRSGRNVRNRNNNVGTRTDDGVRRSNRKKKLLYGTFDPKILERALYVDKQTYDGVDQSRKRKRNRDVDPCDVEKDEDMYSRVKRQRKQIKRNMYGVPIENSDTENTGDDEDNTENDDESSSDEEDDEDEEEEEEEEGEDDDQEEEEEQKPQQRSYNLRENKPRTQWFEVSNFRERRPRKPPLFHDTPNSPVKRRHREVAYRSPAHRKNYIRKRSAFHVTSSTSSSEPGSSDDEEHFQKRKAKSMAKARSQMLPMNMNPSDMASSTLMRDRIRAGASMADVDPMSIDRSVKFDSVGGLGKHIRALKEMIVFPLLYPEVFQRFRIEPPRGVLFYGPPGTGKTLVARALANECSIGQKRVAFFMRKGADCLSKWVGESERQLRLLFDQAYQMRPSIIFFDEIDGLCPVRSSRQDQIHSSIVSTILALMDGLDSRGEIVVIGATNRIDSIDPALRRPGRFDREFLFPLPSAKARKQIIQIHTKNWNPKLCDSFVSEVAEKCVGYCGADMRSLCTEAALLALRRRYPQIYNSSEKLQLDVNSITIGAKDFFRAMQNIVPASQRSVTSPGRALSKTVRPLLRKILDNSLVILKGIFPSVLAQLSGLDLPVQSQEQSECGGMISDDDLLSDDDEDRSSIFEPKDKRKKRPEQDKPYMDFQSYACRTPITHRPRLLISGKEGQGQTSHLAPALLHYMEQLPVHVLDLPALFAVTAKTPEESCAQIFREARRTSPSIIYMPHVNQWWDVIGETLKATVMTLMQDLEPSSPLLTLATSEVPHDQLDFQLCQLFSSYCGEVIRMTNPKEEERREYFADLIINQTVKPPSTKYLATMRMLEVLPKAPPPEPRKLTERELKLLHEKEENTLRELRLFLRDVINKLVKDRKFLIFARPVEIDEVPDYYDIIKRPMDLSMMMSKIDMHQYQTAKEFMIDIDLICSNALEYNPDRDPAGRVIRHRACALKDTAYALMKTELDPNFERQCEEILQSRKARGESPTKTAPDFYITKPRPTSMSFERLDDSPKQRERFSRRVRGLHVEEERRIEEIERRWNRRPRSTESSPDHRESSRSPVTKSRRSLELKLEKISTKTPVTVTSDKEKSAQKSSSSTKPKKREVWTYKKRRRRSKVKFATGSNQSQNNDNRDDDDDDDDDAADDDDDIEIETLEDNSDDEVIIGSNCNNDQPLPQAGHQDSCSPRSRQEFDVSPQSAAVSPGRLHAAAVSPRLNSAAVSTRHGPLHVDTDLQPLLLETKPTSPVFSSGRRTSVPTLALERQLSNSSDKLSAKSPRNQIDPPVLEPEPGPSVAVERRSPTPKLHPAHIEIDSGISSNGDSVDSIEHMKQLAAKKMEQANLSSNAREKPSDLSHIPVSPNVRTTRAKNTPKYQEKMAGTSTKHLRVDKQRLSNLLDNIVLSTRDFNIERLEKLYSMLSQCIYRYRNDYDKTEMIKEMEEICRRNSVL